MKQKLASWSAGILIGIYLILTLPSLFSSRHFLYNLEPYPDGLYYVVPSLNLLGGRGFQLVYDLSKIRVSVPPLYSLSLLPIFVFLRGPQFFYLTNVLLGLGSLWFLYRAVRQETQSWVAGCVAAGLLLLHGYFLWLASVPLAENLSVTLMCGGLWLLSLPKLRIRHTIIAAVVTAGLVLTKFALLPVAIALGVLFVIKLVRVKFYRTLTLFLSVGAVTTFIEALYQLGWVRYDPSVVLSAQQETKSTKMIVAFASEYLWSNFLFYGRTLLGMPTHFLWQSWPFTSPLLLVGAVLSVIWGLVKQQHRFFFLSCVTLFLAQLIMTLPFYVADARYMTLSLALLAAVLGVGWQILVEKLGRKKLILWSYLMVGLVFAALIVTQFKFYREILAANLFQRSRAWQYESIQHLNQFFADKKDSYLITVLPPYLIDVYTNRSYRVLPLSLRQEFMNKAQRPWGKLDYENLPTVYKEVLASGREVFVTNAYLSSQHDFD